MANARRGIAPTYWFLLALLTAISVGALVIGYSARAADEQRHCVILDRASWLAATIRVRDLGGHRGTDAMPPAYVGLDEQLRRIRQALPEIRSICLLGQHPTDAAPSHGLPDGTPDRPGDLSTGAGQVPLLHLATSEAEHIPGSMAGGAMQDVARALFAGGPAALYGPYDEAGDDRVAAVVPHRDSFGRTWAALVVEFTADVWRAALWRALAVPIALSVVLVAIVVASARLLRWRSLLTTGARRGLVARYTEALIALAVGLTLTAMLTSAVDARDEIAQQRAFGALASARASIVAKTLDDLGDEQLEGLAHFFVGSEHVDRAEFAAYAGHLTGRSVAAFWGWVAPVAGHERESLVAQVRAEGLPTFAIRDLDASGALHEAPVRETHYPLLYLEPSAEEASLVGLDLWSLPAARRALEQAAATGLAVASDRVYIPHAAGAFDGLLVVRPVLAPGAGAPVQGFALAAFSLDRLLHQQVALDHLGASAVLFDLYELQEGGALLLAASTFPAGAPSRRPPALSDALVGTYSLTAPLRAFGRSYLLVVYPGPGFADMNPIRKGWLVGVGGLVLTASLAALIGLLAARRVTLEDEVRRRTDILARERIMLRTIVDHLPVGVHVLDTSLRWTMANRTDLRRLRGRLEDDVRDRSDVELLPPEVAAEVLRLERVVLDSGQALLNQEVQVPGSDGQRCWLSVSIVPLRDEDLRIVGLVCVDDDVTERKRAEETLRASEERLRVALQNAPVTAYSQDRQLRYTWIYNPPPGRLPEDLLGRTDAEVLQAGDAAQLTEIKERVLETGLPARDEVRITIDGMTLWYDLTVEPFLDAFGQVMGVTCAAVDITSHRRAEEALRVSEERFRHLAENAQDVIYRYRLHPERGFEYVSPAALAITGYTPEEHYADPDLGFKLVHPDDRHLLEELASAEGQAGAPLLLRWMCKDGRVIWTEQRNVMIYDADGQLVAIEGIARDVTARTEAQEALRASEERFHTLFEAMTEGVVLYEMVYADGQAVDYRIVDANPAFESHTGLARDAVRGRLGSDVYQQHPAPYVDRYRAVAETGAPDIFEDYYAPLGRYYRVSAVSAAPGTFYAVFEDISERKRTEEELRKLSAAVEQSPASVLITDLEGRIEYVNPRFTEVTGYTLDEARGSGARLLDGTGPSEVRSDRRETLDRDGVWRGDLQDRKKNGSLFWARTVISPIRDGEGRPTHWLSLKEDITGYKQLEEQLSRAQKLEAVGRLAGGVAHDFNNMLGVILGHAELAMAEADPTQPAFDDLQEIMVAGQRSTDLVRQLLAFARRQTATPRDLDLNDGVSGMLGMLQRLIGEDIDLAWLPGDDLWRVHMDPSQLDQVLTNLVVNARDAIGGVGKVTIETANVAFDNDYCAVHTDCVPGEYVMLAVSDDGCGMSRETLTHIFEPFYTTKGPGEGTGLGLATVYGIVTQNEGLVNVYSEQGDGTTFRIYLPRHQGAVAERREPGVAAASPTGHETILVVEDDPGLLAMTLRMLARLGYHALGAAGPEEALALCRREEAPVHLLMTDVVMPTMNGRELSDQVTRQRPVIKVLYVSGYTSNVIAHRGVLEEGVRFLPKPYSVAKLASAVRAALDGAGRPPGTPESHGEQEKSGAEG